MENNNGRGIFYGVIGVATLVVAIIGATFAYFSASVTQNDAINVASTTLELNIIDPQSNFRTDMIPVETVDNNGLFYTYPGLTEDDCYDDVGNSICSVYQFTVENPSTTTAQTVVGSLKVTANTGFDNLTYAVFKGAAADITSYNVNATAAATVTMNGTTKTDAANGTVVVARQVIGDTNTEYEWPMTEERLDPEETTTYTVVVWLEEAGVAQDEEQGKTFAASITFTSDNGGGVTGVLSASS